jgi:hypothetical protein
LSLIRTALNRISRPLKRMVHCGDGRVSLIGMSAPWMPWFGHHRLDSGRRMIGSPSAHVMTEWCLWRQMEVYGAGGLGILRDGMATMNSSCHPRAGPPGWGMFSTNNLEPNQTSKSKIDNSAC